jgi:hypothetical protein
MAEAAPPRTALWLQDAGEARAYAVSWSGETGAVHLVPVKTR